MPGLRLSPSVVRCAVERDGFNIEVMSVGFFSSMPALASGPLANLAAFGTA